jgi:hypothetical protein
LFGDILRTLENKRKGNNEIDKWFKTKTITKSSSKGKAKIVNNYSEEDNLSNEFESDSDDDID